MAAFGAVTGAGAVLRPQAGVYWHQRDRCDLFFVTLNKPQRDDSSTTMYHDYPVSPTRFHWQSQSATREGSPTGQERRQARPAGLRPDLGTPHFRLRLDHVLYGGMACTIPFRARHTPYWIGG